MTFVNTDGMAFIGPGSEWFWTAMSGLVLAITFLAIYRQLRAQRSASAFEQLTAVTDEWAAERLTRKRLAVWIAIRDGRALPDLPAEAAGAIVDFWEKVGGLVRARHVPLPVVDGMLGNSLQMWWEVVEQFNATARLQWMDPEIRVNFEWLAARSTGTHPPITDPEFLRKNLGRIIAAQESALRDWEAMRTAILPPPAPAPESVVRRAEIEAE